MKGQGRWWGKGEREEEMIISEGEEGKGEGGRKKKGKWKGG